MSEDEDEDELDGRKSWTWTTSFDDVLERMVRAPFLLLTFNVANSSSNVLVLDTLSQ